MPKKTLCPWCKGPAILTVEEQYTVITCLSCGAVGKLSGGHGKREVWETGKGITITKGE